MRWSGVRGWVARAAGLITTVGVIGCDRGEAGERSGPLAFSASDVHVLGTSESIAIVRDLELLSDGSVWLLNSTEPLFIGFDGTGEVIAAHGTTGGGPEEFRMPSAFVTRGVGAEAWVLDLVRHALIRVSEPDEWAEVSIPQEVIPAGSLRGGMDMMSPTVRTARMGREVVLPRTTGSMASGIATFRMAILGADLMALDLETDAVREVVSLRDALGDPSEGFVATEGGFPLWYRLWAACGDDELRVYDRVRHQLRGFSPAGAELAAVPLSPDYRTEVTPREFARVIFPLRQAEATGAVGSRLSAEDSLRLLNEMAQGVRGEPHELAAYLPRYVDFRCSDDGTMWLQPLDLEAGGLKGGSEWIRVSPGQEAQEVHLPPRFDAVRFFPNRIWGVQRNDLDVASVAWIDLAGG